MNVKEHILAAIRECLAKNLPASGKAILFGSQARGTAREDSDWDILIILDKKKLMAADYDNITYPLTELGWELGEEINPVMYTAQEWEKYRNTPFVRNVEKEGVKYEYKGVITNDTASLAWLQVSLFTWLVILV